MVGWYIRLGGLSNSLCGGGVGDVCSGSNFGGRGSIVTTIWLVLDNKSNDF